MIFLTFAFFPTTSRLLFCLRWSNVIRNLHDCCRVWSNFAWIWRGITCTKKWKRTLFSSSIGRSVCLSFSFSLSLCRSLLAEGNEDVMVFLLCSSFLSSFVEGHITYYVERMIQNARAEANGERARGGERKAMHIDRTSKREEGKRSPSYARIDMPGMSESGDVAQPYDWLEQQVSSLSTQIFSNYHQHHFEEIDIDECSSRSMFVVFKASANGVDIVPILWSSVFWTH